MGSIRYDVMNDIDRPPRILAVDDRERNIRLLERILVPQGYEIIVAHNGIQALERVAEDLPDLVVLDEPTDGLDPIGRREDGKVLVELARDGLIKYPGHFLFCTLIAGLPARQKVKPGWKGIVFNLGHGSAYI
jgi:DNA-binding NarL/FixJ family response regulator